MDQIHIPVLKDELLTFMEFQSGQIVVDATFGRGGHAKEVLKSILPNGLLIVFDRDKDAIQSAEKIKEEMKLSDENFYICHGDFSQVKKVCEEKFNIKEVDRIYADIGVSSPQLDNSGRGFSFQNDEPLDMRMNAEDISLRTAEEILMTESKEELARIFWELGEEPKSRQIADRIIDTRRKKEIKTTKDLVEIITRSLHYKTKSRKHPATKVFQALRIEVNQELDELRKLMEDGFSMLKPQGRLGIISFHSLESRLVKNYFKRLAGKIRDEIFLTEEKILGKIIKPFPIKPKRLEILKNRRSRSAELRVIEKI